MIKNASPTSTEICLIALFALMLSSNPKNAQAAAISSVPSVLMIGPKRISNNLLI